MEDEEFLFKQDSKEKKNIARSARNARTHTGRRGRVKLPSDYMTRKELQAMNGECKSYRLNEPMVWKEFKAMPDDIKITYIKLIRQKYDATDGAIAEMLDVCKNTFKRECARLGIKPGKGARGRRKWDRKGFYAWKHGASVADEEVIVNEPEMEDQAVVEKEMNFASVEFEKHPANEESIIAAELATTPIIKKAIPKNGTLTFNCAANDAMETITSMLGDMRVTITVAWEEDFTTAGCKREGE